jgi:peroxiredoxin (alkyl hydroperoxide reductase subunit C)
MSKEFKPGCAQPIKDVKLSESVVVNEKKADMEEKKMIKVGQKAPNFELPAYHKGEFKSFKLDEFLGKWVVLCFYPGDFTFV